MRSALSVFLLVAGLLGAGYGCDRGSHVPQQGKGNLEDLFAEGSFDVLFSGQSFHYVSYALRDGVTPDFAASEIAAYLRGLPGARRSRWPVLEPLSHDYGVLHERDMWAMILAELNGIKLSIPADGRGPHEKIIAEVLRRIDNQLIKDSKTGTP